ncbi:MAG: hypothetical protein AVDCRST_MAG30-3494, partial [uncultured Solirubrobacteraceae bacterium]
ARSCPHPGATLPQRRGEVGPLPLGRAHRADPRLRRADHPAHALDGLAGGLAGRARDDR